MNGRYSSNSVWTTSCRARSTPKWAANGIRKASAQKAEVLPKWWCQKLGAVSGTRAIESRTPRKGTIHTGDNVAPGNGDKPSTAAAAGATNASTVPPTLMRHRIVIRPR